MASIAAIGKPYLGLLEEEAAGQADHSRVDDGPSSLSSPSDPDPAARLPADGRVRSVGFRAAAGPSSACRIGNAYARLV